MNKTFMGDVFEEQDRIRSEYAEEPKYLVVDDEGYTLLCDVARETLGGETFQNIRRLLKFSGMQIVRTDPLERHFRIGW